jgi:hypothetical protein
LLINREKLEKMRVGVNESGTSFSNGEGREGVKKL